MQLKNLLAKVLRSLPQILLVTVALIHFVVALRMNWASYDNFDFGKFDLGNMTQMVWNTLHGRTLYLTDYFGTNLPRWSMSHVDPILLLFVPVFFFYQHPLTLVFSQVFLITISSFILYFLADLLLKSKMQAMFVALAFLLYPAVGFLAAKTTFHGVTVAIPFFLLAIFVYEKMCITSQVTKTNLLLFWLFSIITMSGKEQLPVYVFLFSLFAIFFRLPAVETRKVKLNLVALMIVSFVWACLAFFVIIPHYASYRADGYQKFAKSLDIDTDKARDVDLPNYFLTRYDAFGDSYSEVIVNMILNPKILIAVAFGGDKIENLNNTFAPILYMPIVAPQVLLVSS